MTVAWPAVFNIGGGQILGIFQMLMLSERSQTKKKKEHTLYDSVDLISWKMQANL